MPVGTSDGQYFEDEFEHAHSQIFGKQAQNTQTREPTQFNSLSKEEQQGLLKSFDYPSTDEYKDPRLIDEAVRGGSIMRVWPDISNQDMYTPEENAQRRKENEPFKKYFDNLPDDIEKIELHEFGKDASGKDHPHNSTILRYKGKPPLVGQLDSPKQDHKLFFVRHGETEENEEDLVREKNAQLTPKGEKQAASAARQLKSEGVDAIVSSGLDRARKSAHIIASKLGIVPQFDDRLNTWDVGNLEGTPCKDSDPKIKSAMADTPDKPVAGGESFNDFKDRAFDGIRDAILNNQGKKLAILTHSKVEEALDRWNKTGQDNPDLDVKSKMQTGVPGSVEPFTMKANSTIMQGSQDNQDNFDQRFTGTRDFGRGNSDTFNQRFEGEPGMLPIGIPGEDFTSVMHSNASLVQPPPFPGSKEEIEQGDASHILRMPFNPDKNQDDLNLYNPVGELPNTMKLPAEAGGRGGSPSGKSVPIGEEGRSKLERMLAQGKTYKEIAEAFNTTRNAIAGKVRDWGLTGKGNKPQTRLSDEEARAMEDIRGQKFNYKPEPNWFKEEMNQ